MTYYCKIMSKMALISLLLFSISYSGTLYDYRDGKSYLTIKIGDYEWMAENLNYETEHSKCYDGKSENCALLGRLYVWPEAMNACPDGWHLPSEREFISLADAVSDADFLGKKIKSASRWDGSNELEYSAVPGGSCFYDVESDSFSCSGREKYAFFWSSERINRDSTYVMFLKSGWSSAGWDKFAFVLYENKDVSIIYFSSVRCVKNNTEVVERNEPSIVYRGDAVPEKPTAICRDGTLSYSQSRSGTCAGHGGVESWKVSENSVEKSDWVDDALDVGIAVGKGLLKAFGAALEIYNSFTPPQSNSTSIRCKDGTFSNSQSRNGTCSHHGGVDDWGD